MCIRDRDEADIKQVLTGLSNRSNSTKSKNSVLVHVHILPQTCKLQGHLLIPSDNGFYIHVCYPIMIYMERSKLHVNDDDNVGN